MHGLGLLAFALLLAACNEEAGETAGGSGSATGDGGTASGSSDGGGVCVEDCQRDEDCTDDDDVCREGVCQRVRCDEVSCEDMNLVGLVCVETQGLPACVIPCAADADCGEDELVCDGMGDDGTRYCVFDLFCTTDGDCTAGLSCRPVAGRGLCIAVCTSDADCDTASVCIEQADDGTRGCVPRQCSTDADCTGNGHCESGFCRCSGDDECAEGVCFGLG